MSKDMTAETIMCAFCKVEQVADSLMASLPLRINVPIQINHWVREQRLFIHLHHSHSCSKTLHLFASWKRISFCWKNFQFLRLGCSYSLSMLTFYKPLFVVARGFICFLDVRGKPEFQQALCKNCLVLLELSWLFGRLSSMPICWGEMCCFCDMSVIFKFIEQKTIRELEIQRTRWEDLCMKPVGCHPCWGRVRSLFILL